MFNSLIHYGFVFLLSISLGINASPRILSMEKEGAVGKYYPASSPEKRVGVLVLGGSEGGQPELLAKAVVEAGHPTLALAYFNAQALPAELERIPLEYFAQAKTWLQQQKNVKSDELIVVGWSKGAELALLLASKDKQISLVVAIAPSSVVWAGILKDWTKVPASSWTYQGQELVHVPFKPSGPVNSLLDLYKQSLANRVDQSKATIQVETISARVVLMTGEKDEIWPSPQMAEDICSRMNLKQHNSCEHLNYEGLDHLLDNRFLDKNDVLNQTFTTKLNGE